MRVLECFAGTGAGCKAHRDDGDEIVGLIEWIPFRQRVLEARFPGAKIHGDIETYDPTPMRGRIDRITGGVPCKGVSIVGMKEGLENEETKRWHAMRRIVRELKPAELELENVDNMARGEMAETTMAVILDHLREDGYGGAWCLLSSSQVGLKHQRGRWWLHAERRLKGKGFVQIDTPMYKDSFGMFTGWIGGKTFEPGAVQRMGRLWPTPRCGGMGTKVLVRKDGKIRDDLETSVYQEAFCEEVHGCVSTQELIRQADPAHVWKVIGERRLNPDWVEGLHRLPSGWTDPSVSNADLKDPVWVDFRGETDPAERPGYSAQPSRLIEGFDASMRNQRILALGDMQSPDAARAAYARLRAYCSALSR